MQLATAGLLVIKEKKLLLAFSKNKQCFYLPGGKVNDAETAKQALCREIAEELEVMLEEKDLEYYTHITAPAFGEEAGIIMEQDCFFVHQPIHPSAAAEIEMLEYFTLGDYMKQVHKAPGAIMILEKLKKEDFID